MTKLLRPVPSGIVGADGRPLAADHKKPRPTKRAMAEAQADDAVESVKMLARQVAFDSAMELCGPLASAFKEFMHRQQQLEDSVLVIPRNTWRGRLARWVLGARPFEYVPPTVALGTVVDVDTAQSTVTVAPPNAEAATAAEETVERYRELNGSDEE